MINLDVNYIFSHGKMTTSIKKVCIMLVLTFVIYNFDEAEILYCTQIEQLLMMGFNHYLASFPLIFYTVS